MNTCGKLEIFSKNYECRHQREVNEGLSKGPLLIWGRTTIGTDVWLTVRAS